jgi:hypothetical protein
MKQPSHKIRERAWVRTDMNGNVIRNIYNGMVLFDSDEHIPAWTPYGYPVEVEIRSVPKRAKARRRKA